MRTQKGITRIDWKRQVRMLLGEISPVITDYQLDQKYYAGYSTDAAANKLREEYFS